MALELIGHSAGRLDAQRLHRFITAFQSVTPLTMGELWAWPSALKLALLDHLRARADVLAASRDHRLAADRLAAASESSASRRRWPEAVHPAFVIRLLQRSREHGLAAGRLRRDSTPSWPRADRPSRTRSARKASTRRPSRPSWRT